MAKKKFTQLPVADALTGDEIVAIVQSGASKQTTAQDIADLGGGGGGAVESVTGDGVGGTSTNPVLTFPSIAQVLTTGNVIDSEDQSLSISNGSLSIGSPPNPTAIVINGDGTTELNIGSDATGDMFRRSSAGVLERRTPAQVLGDIGAEVAGAAATVAGNLAAHVSDTTDAHAGTAIGNTPAGNIAATTVQAAINELDSEKVAKSGDTMSGNLAMGTNKVTGLGAASANGEAVRFEQLPSASSETVSGLIEIATQAEVTSGTDDVRSVTPLKLSTETRGVQDLFIPAAAMWPRVTGGCSALTQSEIATSLFNIQSLDFDQTTQEFAQCQIVLPRKWNNGTVTAVVYWTAAAGSGTVQWGISGGAYSDDDALSTALGTAQTADDTLITTNDLHISPATSAITIAGTPADADFLAFQISRNPASDTLSADAKLLGISIRITTDASKDA